MGIPLKEKDKKEQRALRFGIPLKKDNIKGNNNQKNKRKSNERNDGGGTSILKSNRNNNKSEQQNSKNQKKNNNNENESLLPKVEIEKRAEKFSLGQDKIDKFKAMLRQHRFSSA